MPKKVTFVSSISGAEVKEAEAYLVRISGPGDFYFESDVTKAEAEKVVTDTKAEKKAPRGRKAKTA